MKNEPVKPVSHEDFGAVVWKLCSNSAVQGPTNENGIAPYLKNGEFVELDEYECVLRKYLHQAERIEELEAENKRLEDAVYLMRLRAYELGVPEIGDIGDKALSGEVNDD